MRPIDASTDECSSKEIPSRLYGGVNTNKERESANLRNAYDVNEVVKRLEERTSFLRDRSKYSTMMAYEVSDLADDLIDIVKRGGSHVG